MLSSFYFSFPDVWLQSRAKQHANDVENKSEKTVLAKNSKENNDFENIKVFHTEQNKLKCEILEVSRVQMKKNSYNFRTDTANLKNICRVFI